MNQRDWHYIAQLCWCAFKNLLTRSLTDDILSDSWPTQNSDVCSTGIWGANNFLYRQTDKQPDEQWLINLSTYQFTHTARLTTALQRLLTHAIVYLHHINNIFKKSCHYKYMSTETNTQIHSIKLLHIVKACLANCCMWCMLH